MKKQKILITGAAGFIGNHLAKKFIDSEHEVLGWDIAESKDDFEIKKIDMSSIECIKKELLLYNPDVIVHCAGCADVGKSVLNPYKDYDGNVSLTHNIMFSLHELEMKNTRFVFLSSASVYGNPNKLPITEDMDTNPLSPYAVHKVMCEDLCRYFNLNYGMDVKVARIFSAYGAGLRKQIFWDMFCKSKSGALSLFGTGYESRDYIHVNDVVNALYLIATVQSNNIYFNVANGEETTIHQVADIFAKYAKIDEKNILFNGVVREGDPINWKADISNIKKLGYKKTVDIDKGIAAYLEWCNNVEKNK